MNLCLQRLRQTTGGDIVSSRRVLEVGALAWAGVAVVVALGSLREVNSDARLLVGAAAIVGPLAAVGAARTLARGSDRLAGVLLLVSVLTPTYFAWLLNVPALVVALALLAAPRAVLRQRGRENKQEHQYV